MSATFSSIGPPIVSIHRSSNNLSYRRIPERPRPRCDRCGEIRDDVGMRDKVHGERGREKALHPRVVVEHLAIQIATVPAQQNVADLKDDDQGKGLLRDIGLCQACPAPAPIASDGVDLDINVYIHNIHR